MSIRGCFSVWRSKNGDVFADLGRRAIYHATFRDAGSGGIVRVYHMKSTGFVSISHDDCMELHYKYRDEKLDALESTNKV